MRAIRSVAAAVVTGLCVLAALPAMAQVTVLTAQRIDTMDPLRPRAQAMAWDADGRIVRVGSSESVLQAYPDATRVDVGDATVIPGLIDAHGHLLGQGLTHLTANLVGTTSKAEVIERLRAFEATLPEGEWLVGNGWDQNDWAEKVFPSAADLDAAFPERPVWLDRIDGHAGWANSAAMRAVDRDLSGDWQPDGGKVVRDATGEPTGLFVDAAMGVVSSAMPPFDAADVEKALKLAMRDAVSNGLTGVHDAGVSLQTLRVMQALADAGELPIRITAMADGDGDALDWLCAEGQYQHPSQRLQMRTVKFFIDGALGSRGAALLEDYSDDHGNMGLLLMSPEQAHEAVQKAGRCRVQVATHAIGDRGNRVVLDSYEAVLGNRTSQVDHRWRVEHAQILAPQDLPRLAALHVIASMQPTHATSDMPWAEDRLGPQRINGAYAWRKLRDSGARLALGSDFPVERVDPRLGLYAAVTRTDAEGMPAGGWHPEDKLTAYEALRGFTLDAAYAGFAEKQVGSLVAGKHADFVVLAQDPLAVAPAALRELTIRSTWVDGKPVYEAR